MVELVRLSLTSDVNPQYATVSMRVPGRQQAGLLHLRRARARASSGARRGGRARGTRHCSGRPAGADGWRDTAGVPVQQ
eukprot:3066588-Prymnesium_polylepis.2